MDRQANIARHQVIVMGIGDMGLRWAPHKYWAMAESLQAEFIPHGRKRLDQLHKLNPAATVLLEVAFFEENEKGLPPDHPWWLRDANGQRVQFWPGTYRMDLSNAEYVAHVARRIAALAQAVEGRAGVFLDNLRFDEKSRAGWVSLLKQIRETCGDKFVILVNAGRTSDNLDWVVPYVNGIMYEDAVAYAPGGDEEVYYTRIACLDLQLRQPRISLNERYGPPDDLPRMKKEHIRTLVYTDMCYLYADSTEGHQHNWYACYDATLGAAVTPPAQPRPAALARRDFAGGIVLWLPASAAAPQTVTLSQPMHDIFMDMKTDVVTLAPGSGTILVK